MSFKQHVVIVGAGILGLSIAHELAETQLYDLTIIASYMPSDYNESELDKDGYLYKYTSLWAGAHYRPFPHTTSQGRFEQELTRVTYRRFQEIAARYPESSIKFMEGYDYIEKPSEEYSSLQNGYNSEFLDGFETVCTDKLPGISFGAKYNTWCVNSPVFLKFLQKQLLNKSRMGGPFVRFVKADVGSLEDVMALFSKDPRFVGLVDASGTGLKLSSTENGSPYGDPACYSIRGQTLMLQSDKLKETSYYNKTITFQTINPDNKLETDWTFIIPRPPLESGVFILGGTKQVQQDLQILPLEEDRNALLKRAEKLFPELFGSKTTPPQYKIIKNVVGFRPARKGGLRIDKEWYRLSDFAGIPSKFAIRSYGAAGMGYELSFGVAAMVKQLVKNEPSEKL